MTYYKCQILELTHWAHFAKSLVNLATNYTTNHGNMYLHFKFVASLRRYAESYLLVYKALNLVHII